MTDDNHPVPTLIWEWPMRIWHWAFALCLCGSLATGLSGEIAAMDWHLPLGYCAIGLLLFRLIWGLVGGLHSRWRWYRPSLPAVVQHFRGVPWDGGHTAPGVLLALVLLLAAAVQVVSGLYTTDEIFTEGPLVRGADADLVDVMSAIHHRTWWVVIAAISAHLVSHLIYALRGSRLPLAMLTGTKLAAPGTPASGSLLGRGIVTGAAIALAVWGALAWLG